MRMPFAFLLLSVAAVQPSAAQQPSAPFALPCSAHTDPALYPNVSRLVPAEVPATKRGQLRGVVVRTLTWRPGELIKVCFRSGTQAARARVVRFASEWMQFANVKLDFGDADDPRSCAGDNHEAIKIDFIDTGPKSGFWSAIGTMSRKSDHSLNLSYLGRDKLPVDQQGRPMPEAEARRLILHEFGHALGLLHEHQSPQGQCGQEYYEEAVMAYGALRGWPREQTISNFRQYNQSEELNATAVDRKSIMHYSLPPWLFKTGDKSACFVPVNFELSEGDKAFMERVYPKGPATGPGPLASAPERSVTRGVVPPASRKAEEDYVALLRASGLPQSRIDELVAEFRKGL